MKSLLLFAGFFAVTLNAFAAEPAPGGLKTNVVAPSAPNPSRESGNSTTPLPAGEIFGGASFKVYQGDADVTNQVFVPGAGPQKPELRFQPGQVYRLVRDIIPTEPENAVRGRRPLPVAFGGVGRNRTGAMVPFTAQPYFLYGRVPLSWDPSANAYASGLTVFYVVEPEGVTPPPNFAVQVGFEAVNGSVQPMEISMTPTEQSQRVMVRTTSLDRPAVFSMKIGEYEFKSAITVFPELGSIALVASAAEIPGFGAGQTALRLERLDPLGRPVVSNEALKVSLTVDSAATVASPSVTIPAGSSSAEIMLKSTGSGLATVTATTAEGPSVTVKVKVRPVLGGLQLRSDTTELAGFGAGQAELRVQRVDPAGILFLADEALEVTFAVTGPAAVTPATITIPPGASDAAVTVKSSGFGSVSITAAAAGKSSAPFSMVMRSVLGGLKLAVESSSIADFGAGQTDVRVQRLDPTGAPLAGEDPLPVTFTVDGAGKLTPATVTIPAGESSARVNLRSTGEGVVSIIAKSGETSSEASAVKLTKVTHRLQLAPQKNTALGLGFGQVKINITRQDGLGKEYADPESLTVPLELTGPGLLETPVVALKAGEASTTVRVKASGSGLATLKVTGDVPGNPVEIRFVWPWTLILAALIGSALGGAARHLIPKGESKRPLGKLAIVGAIISGMVVIVGLLGAKIGVIPQGLVVTLGGALLFAGTLGLLGTFAVDKFLLTKRS